MTPRAGGQRTPGDGAADDELVRAASHGDHQAFAALIRRHQRLIDAACATVIPAAEERRDAVQEALRDIWRGLASFRGEAAVSTWMYTVARRSSLRSLRRLPAPDPDRAPSVDPGPENAVATREAVRWALGRLPGDAREALLLHTQAGLSMAQIAELQIVSVGTVKSRVSRARQTLRELLGES